MIKEVDNLDKFKNGSWKYSLPLGFFIILASCVSFSIWSDTPLSENNMAYIVASIGALFLAQGAISLGVYLFLPVSVEEIVQQKRYRKNTLITMACILVFVLIFLILTNI